jgi:hypothetical protein
LDSSSSSGDGTESFEATAERVGGEDVEIDAAGTVSEEETIAAQAASTEETTAPDVSSGEGVVMAEASTNEDLVSMDELEATEASSDDVSTASASNPKFIERAIDEHVVVGAVTSAIRIAETTPVTITSSGGTAQGNPSRSGSHTDPTLFDSSPSTLHYVRRARRGSMVSTDSERTISTTSRVPTPPSPLHESGGIASTPIVIVAVLSAVASVQGYEAASAAAAVVPGSEEVLVHISDVLEGNTIGDTPVENIVVGTDLGTGVTQIGHAKAAANADPDLADVTLGSDIPAMEGTLAQDPVDDVFVENMADTQNSYDEVLAEIEEYAADAQAVDLEVAALVAAHMSPIETSTWLLINILLFFLLDGCSCSSSYESD